MAADPSEGIPRKRKTGAAKKGKKPGPGKGRGSRAGKKRSHGGTGYDFSPTTEQRNKVEIWRAGGMSEPDCALVLKISLPTFRKHFAYETKVGAMTKRAEVLEAMHRTAISGNVSAQKGFLQKSEAPPPPKRDPWKSPGQGVGQGAAYTGPVNAPDPAAAKPAKAPVLGKKEQAALEAETAAAGTPWAHLSQLPGTETPQ